MPAALVEKLHALAERRCAHFTELQQSGRWSRYYSEKDFAACVSDATDVARQWRQMRETGDAAVEEGANGPAAMVFVTVRTGTVSAA